MDGHEGYDLRTGDMGKIIFIVCLVFSVVVMAFLIRSYSVYDEVGIPAGKNTQLIFLSTHAKITLEKEYYTERSVNKIKLSSTPAEVMRERIDNLNLRVYPMAEILRKRSEYLHKEYHPITVPYPWDTPSFKRFNLTRKLHDGGTYSVSSITFPHWLLLVLFLIYPIIRLGKRRLSSTFGLFSKRRGTQASEVRPSREVL